MSNKKIEFETGQAPLQHENHKRPVSRRDFLAQGMVAGAGFIAGPSLLGGILGRGSEAFAAAVDCGLVDVSKAAPSKTPFICVDLAGGANIAGSNVMVGVDSQLNFLTESGYAGLGLPAAMNPANAGQIAFIDGSANPNVPTLAFHASSAMLRGIRNATTADTLTRVNGAVICARSSNDTGNNPHNPVYGINKAGSNGALVNLVGTRTASNNNNAGGRSQAPTSMFDATKLPTRVSSTNEARGLADTGALGVLLPKDAERDALVKAVENISDRKIELVNKNPTLGTQVNKILSCGYAGASNTIGGITSDALDPTQDAVITGIMGGMNTTALNNGARNLGNSEYARTAAVMKLVVSGFAGAGTIQLGGYDYHNNKRTRGEQRDEKAGECIGMALEYAAKLGQKTMIYVFSDGSVSGNGTIDPDLSNRNNGEEKFGWRGDSSTRAAVMMLVYDPAGKPVMRRTQVGGYQSSGTVNTGANPASSDVGNLAETVVLNYLSIHNEVGRLNTVLPNNGIGGNTATVDTLLAFEPV